MQLDHESADLIAANSIRETLALHPNYLSETVERTVFALQDANKIGAATASYVIRNSRRFVLLPAPRFFSARCFAPVTATESPRLTGHR
ncbi:MAG: hypothetical protein ABIZ04_18825 [Opitutus sp.]